MPDQKKSDRRAFELRERGRSFSRIAVELGLEKASSAVDAFNRALRLLPAADLKRARAAELGRLDGLTERVKGGADEDGTLKQRLKNIDAMRKRLLAP